MDNFKQLIVLSLFVIYSSSVLSVTGFQTSSIPAPNTTYSSPFDSLLDQPSNIGKKSDFQTLLDKPSGKYYRQAQGSFWATSDEFKTLLDKPRSSTFAKPAPTKGLGTITRLIPLSPSAMGAGMKNLAMKGASWQFQLALIGAGFLYEEFTEDEIAADPNIIEGDWKRIYTEETSTIADDGHTVGTLKLIYTDMDDDGIPDPEAYLASRPDFYNGCLAYGEGPGIHYIIESPWITYICDKDPEEIIEEIPMSPIDAEEFFRDIMDDDDLMDAFDSSPEAQQEFEESQPFIDTFTDVFDDLMDGIDINPDGTPDLSTEPSRDANLDDALDTLSVPAFEDNPLTSSDTDFESDPDLYQTTEVQTETFKDGLETTTTTTTTTTTRDKKTDLIVSTQTETERKITTIPDPTEHPDPETAPDPETTTTTTTETENGYKPPQKVEVVNWPAPVAPLPAPADDHWLCEEHPNILACLDVGDPDEPPEPEEYIVPFDFQVHSFTSNESCPAPISFHVDLDNSDHELSYQPLCDGAVMINPIVVAIGIILAFYIVSDSVRAGA